MENAVEIDLRPRVPAGAPEVKLAGIILAGGASRRMGSPKALLEYQGETFLDRLIRIFNQHCDVVTVVLGHEPTRIQSGLQRGAQAQFVVNQDHALGQLSSLQCGLLAPGSESAGAFMYSPLDYPRIESETLRRLRAMLAPEDSFVIPRFNGERGHPVLFRSEVRSEFLMLPPDGTARDVVHRHVSRTRYVDVDDPGILRDIDDPAAYRELLNTVELR